LEDKRCRATNVTPHDPELSQQTHVDLALRTEEAWPFFAEDEVAAVADVLRSGRVNQWTGDTVSAFQSALAARFGGGHGIALMNGSVALELPLLAFGIGPGDEVIVSPRSFVASASCVRLVGATPVFADVDRDSGNLSARTIEAALTEKTKAVIPVHIGGWPVDMPEVMELAKSRGFRVIEDCAQAHGAEIAGQPVGSFGHAAAFSFCQDKIISTGGEGGYTSFRNYDEWKWAWSYKDHGKSWNKVNSPAPRPGFRWLHDSVGTNWRMTGLQAAVGLVQLSKLDEWLSLRERNANVLARTLKVPGLRVPKPAAGMRHAYYRFYAYVDAGPKSEVMRDEIIARAGAQKLRVFSGSCSEIYLEKAFSDIPQPDLPVARELGKTSLMLETNPTLNPDLLEQRAKALARIISDVVHGQ
jgi:dTDP-4-amino-4,6-dideoxygalactose transaminase